MKLLLQFFLTFAILDFGYWDIDLLQHKSGFYLNPAPSPPHKHLGYQRLLLKQKRSTLYIKRGIRS